MSNLSIFNGLPFDPIRLSRELLTSYSELMEATEAVQIAQADATDRRSEHAAERMRILFNHKDNLKELGSNDTTRDATIKEMTAASTAAVAEAEDILRSKQHAMELARITVEQNRAQLRILEVLAAVATEQGGQHDRS